MKVILLADVKNYGKKGDLVEVNDGYARNFLFPKKLAVDASKKSLEILKNEQALAKENDEKNRQEALALAKKLETLSVTFYLPVGKDGKVSGSVSTKHIVESFEKEHHLKLDKRKIKENGPFHTLGKTVLTIELYKQVNGMLTVFIQEKQG